MRKLIALRRKDADELAEEEAMLDTYKRALGMLTGTPLGEAAMSRASRKGMPSLHARRAAHRSASSRAPSFTKSTSH
jgi:hypothetical protein